MSAGLRNMPDTDYQQHVNTSPINNLTPYLPVNIQLNILHHQLWRVTAL